MPHPTTPHHNARPHQPIHNGQGRPASRGARQASRQVRAAPLSPPPSKLSPIFDPSSLYGVPIASITLKPMGNDDTIDYGCLAMVEAFELAHPELAGKVVYLARVFSSALQFKNKDEADKLTRDLW